MTIRRATAKDSDALWELRCDAILSGCAGFYPAAVLQHWTEGEMPPGFTQMIGEAFYLQEIDQQAVASGMLDIINGKIEALFVAPAHMGKGLGKRMLTFLETQAKAHGIAQLRLEASLNAIAFYQACGWLSVRQDRYHSPRGILLDCMVMHKMLT